jgi:hypothetical protein
MSILTSTGTCHPQPFVLFVTPLKTKLSSLKSFQATSQFPKNPSFKSSLLAQTNRMRVSHQLNSCQVPCMFIQVSLFFSAPNFSISLTNRPCSIHCIIFTIPYRLGQLPCLLSTPPFTMLTYSCLKIHSLSQGANFLPFPTPSQLTTYSLNPISHSPSS